MASAGTLIFELAADVSRLRTDMKKAQDTMNKSLASIQKSFAIAGAAAAAAFAAAVIREIKQAIDVVVNNVQDQLSQIDKIGNLSEKLGTSTEALSAFKIQAEGAGSSLDDVATGIKGMSKSLLAARDPTSQAAAAYKAIGLNAKDLKAMKPEEAFKAIAQAMSGFKDGADKVEAARLIFGKAGADLITILDQGGQGFDDAAKKAAAFGQTVSEADKNAVRQFNEQMDNLKGITDGAWKTFSKALLPALTDFAKFVAEDIAQSNLFIDALGLIGDVAIDTAKELVTIQQHLAAFKSSMDPSAMWAGVKLTMGWSKDVQADQKIVQGEMKRTNDIYHSFDGTLNKLNDDQKKFHATLDGYAKASAARAAAMKQTGQAVDTTTKKEMGLGAVLDANTKKVKQHKEQLSDYQKLLISLTDTLAKLQANGDTIKLLQIQPGYKSATEEGKKRLENMQHLIDATQYMQEEDKKFQDEKKANAQAEKDANAQRIDGLIQLAQQYKDIADPMSVYMQQMKTLKELTSDPNLLGDYPKAAAAYMQAAKDQLERAQAAIDPAMKKLLDFKSMVKGWANTTTDAFWEVISGSKSAAEAFGEMITSMMEDLAKFLMYENVFKPMFGKLAGAAGGSGGTLYNFFKSIGGNAMSGRTVQPGGLYRVNESKLRSEYFIPNVPGRVMTSEQMGGAGGVQVNVHLHQNGSSTEDAKGDDKKAIELSKRISTAVRQIIVTEKRAGGLLAS